MRVIIVGGGVIGIASAYHLLKEGVEVTVVDAVVPGSGASRGNMGWVVPSDVAPVAAPGMVLQSLKWMMRRDSPLYIRPSLNLGYLKFLLGMARRCNEKDFRAAYQANLALCQDTLELLDSYASDGVNYEMHSNGLLMAFAEAAALEGLIEHLDIVRATGLDPQVLSAQETSAMESALSSELAGSVYFPYERHVSPETLVAALASRCRELGAQFVDNASLIAVRFASDRHRVHGLVTSVGELHADGYLLAAGAHTGPLSALFGCKLPIFPGKGYSIDYTPAPVSLGRMVNLCDARVAVTPFDGKLRLGGTMEFGGLNTTVNATRVAAIRSAAHRYFADWRPEAGTEAPAWAGARPMTPDGLPTIGSFPGLTNAWVAAGHGMFGITLAAGTGRAMARIVTGQANSAAFAAFDPIRFGSRLTRAFSGTGRRVA